MKFPRIKRKRCGFCKSTEHARKDCPLEAYHGQDAVERENARGARAYDRQIRRAQRRRGMR